jgi:hypothetical protein
VLIVMYHVLMVINLKINDKQHMYKNSKTCCQLKLSICSDLPGLINRTNYIKLISNITLSLLLLSSDKVYDKENTTVGFLCLYTQSTLNWA